MTKRVATKDMTDEQFELFESLMYSGEEVADELRQVAQLLDDDYLGNLPYISNIMDRLVKTLNSDHKALKKLYR